MKVAQFCHSPLSCCNHGNAHFLRGIVTYLRARQHRVRIFGPRSAWSVRNLLLERGELHGRRTVLEAERVGRLREAEVGAVAP